MNRRVRRGLHGLVMLVALVASTQAHALLTSCTFSTAPSGLTFTGYSGLASVSASTTISVTCSGTVGVLVSTQIALSAGNASGFNPRVLSQASPPGTLQYNLYTTAAATQIWGDGTSGTVTQSDSQLLTVLGYTKTWTVYGVVPASQTPKPGTYGGATIVVTLTFN